MSWICPRCETENPDSMESCEVCGNPIPQKTPVINFVEMALDTILPGYSKYSQAAYKGDAEAQYQLGRLYYNYAEYKEREYWYKDAVSWFAKAAEQGHGDAQSMLGECCLQCKGGAKKEDAVYWLEKSVTQGNYRAMANLGLCYGEGIGVPQNYVEASRLLHLSADNGCERAKTLLEIVSYDEYLKPVPESSNFGCCIILAIIAIWVFL